MFAFAIYDKDKDLLFLARDRAGEKPLFYWHSGNSFAFSSELKGLMKCPFIPRRLDLTAMNFYLAYGYVPRDMCILEGVKKLPQGHVLILERQKNLLRSRAYWSCRSPGGTPTFDDANELCSRTERFTYRFRSASVGRRCPRGDTIKRRS